MHQAQATAVPVASISDTAATMLNAQRLSRFTPASYHCSRQVTAPPSVGLFPTNGKSERGPADLVEGLAGPDGFGEGLPGGGVGRIEEEGVEVDAFGEGFGGGGADGLVVAGDLVLGIG
jgi:hypothetical protein